MASTVEVDQQWSYQFLIGALACVFLATSLWTGFGTNAGRPAWYHRRVVIPV